jgi:hypothetical protein
MAIALGGTDKGRLTKMFPDVAEGGQTKGPLAPYAGGAEVGWLSDKLRYELDGQYRQGVAPAL